MSATKASPKAAGSNGNGGAPQDPLAEAIRYEQTIAEMAVEIRAEKTDLTPALFTELLPLLRKPIPQGFIVKTPKVEGKPYESTGIKSVQVQVDRLDNVLGPQNWSWMTTWEQEGKLAEVTVNVWQGHGEDRNALVTRRAMGGVNRGSTIGNLYKGSETNAAKLAFARLGVGHEVYLGATDFDPDTDADVAAEQGKTDPVAQVETIDGDRVAALTDIAQAWVTEPDDKDEQGNRTKQVTRLMRAEGLSGEIKSVTQGFARLTPGMADNVEAWLREQKDGAA